MTSIPETLKSDHLFLLVGGNPLPNWVAARLLLREEGRIYLVHSGDVLKFARNLSRLLIEKGIAQPKYIEISNPSDSDEITSSIVKYLKKIEFGQTGINYTGGTKAMAVHGYRAVENNINRGLPSPVFSYLDAGTLKMYFDGGQGYFVGLNPEVKMNINELMRLHGLEARNEIKKEPVATDVSEALAEIHRTKEGYASWTKHLGKLRKCNPDNRAFEWPSPLDTVGKAIVRDLPVETTISDLCGSDSSTFNNWGQLKNFLQGKWLESHVVNLIRKNQGYLNVNDYGWGFETRGLYFEGDVIAIRGYQCHFISCYSAAKKNACKLKLTEVFVRASQIGGDEARVALMCMSEDPLSVQIEVESLFQAKGRIRVFGRKDLENLEEKLIEWFNEGIPLQEES